MKKKIVVILCCLLCLALVGGISVLCINAYVKNCTKGRILSQEEAAMLDGVDCILVLGCGVWEGGKPSHMLEDRLKQALVLYELGASPKLLMTGDHGRAEYDEVGVMKTYAVDAGIPAEHIFMDHAGFSTYESMYRARDVFLAKKIIIVSQGYHLYRAIYIAQTLGMEAYGVASDPRSYSGQTARNLREVLARVKDVATCAFQLEPTYLGEAIPIWGNGNLTNDESDYFTENEVKQ